MKASARQNAKKLITIQSAIALLIACFMLPISLKAAYSALLAGIICAAANGFFAWRLFQKTAVRQAQQIVWNFYSGELIKLAIIAVLMLISILLFKVSIPVFLLTYVALQVSMLFVPFMSLRRAC